MTNETDEIERRLFEERKRIAAALAKYLTDEPEGASFRGLLDYIDGEYSGSYAEGWMDFNNALIRALDAAEKRGAEQAVAAGVDAAS